MPRCLSETLLFQARLCTPVGMTHSTWEHRRNPGFDWAQTVVHQERTLQMARIRAMMNTYLLTLTREMP